MYQAVFRKAGGSGLFGVIRNHRRRGTGPCREPSFGDNADQNQSNRQALQSGQIRPRRVRDLIFRPERW
jgi:hypothetical protein